MERLPKLRELPVIFISAYGRDQHIRRALKLGADDYILKPFSPTKLVARVRTVLRRSASSEARHPEPSGTRSTAGAVDDQLPGWAGQAGRLSRGADPPGAPHAGRAVDVCRRGAPLAELLPHVWGPAHSGRSGAVRTLVKQRSCEANRDARMARAAAWLTSPCPRLRWLPRS